jgi:hypothetical protein
MELLNDRGRALVRCLLRSPETIAEILSELPESQAAEEVRSIVWLFSGEILTLNHQLAFRPVEQPEEWDHYPLADARVQLSGIADE